MGSMGSVWFLMLPMASLSAPITMKIMGCMGTIFSVACLRSTTTWPSPYIEDATIPTMPTGSAVIYARLLLRFKHQSPEMIFLLT